MAFMDTVPTALSDSVQRIIAFLDTKSPQSSVFYVIFALLILYIVYTAVIAVVRWVIGTVVGFIKFAFFITLLCGGLLIINQGLGEQQRNTGSFSILKNSGNTGWP